MDMQQYHEIRVLRCRLEKVMNQLNILEYTRTQVQIRMTRAAKHRQQSVAYLYEMHLATVSNVMQMYRCYMMNTWNTLEGCEDELVDMGYDSDDAGVIVWGSE